MPEPLPLDLVTLESLAARFGTPLQIYDEELIRTNCRSLLSSFGSRFPGFRQYFAVKALPNPAILRVLVDEGCGLDCSSVAELHIAEELGVTGSDVMYTSNYTSLADLTIASRMGVIINLDDASLLPTVIEANGGKPPALISFRLNPGLGRTDSETLSNVLGGPNAKFGVPPDQIVAAYTAARKAGVKRFGLHMMTGSCVLSDAYWLEAVNVLLDAAARVQAEAGVTEFEFINIGGGLGIPYREGAPRVDLEPLSAALASAFDARWAASGLKGTPPKLYMENGRFMTGPYGWLISRCEAVKEAFGSRYYGLDSSMANLMRPGMYGSYHAITVPAREVVGGPRALANVVGTLCENNDWFAKDRDLPSNAQRGDLFVIHDTGAHSHSMGFQYNGKLRAPEILLRSPSSSSGGIRRAELIRRRETLDYLYGNTVMPYDLAKGIPRSYLYGQKQKWLWLSTATLLASGILIGAAISIVIIKNKIVGRGAN